jgi:hypothetical protein
MQSFAAMLLAGVLSFLGGQPAPANDVRFRWAFGALTGPTTSRQLVRVTDEMMLRSGDQLKMLVSPVSPCFVYVLHQDPRGELTVLLPAPAGAFPAVHHTGAPQLIPAGDDWLELDDATGIERIYLVASSTRLARLETLLKKNARTEVINELMSLRKQHATVDWVERPVTIGGQVRGSKRPDIASMATEISAKTFFSRVFIIDHR